MDTNSFDKLLNRIIDKKYKIDNVVGVGGMAYVLKATELASGKEVALKMLSDEFKDDERAVKRFINESKTVSMLNHKNIVKILDVVITEERKYIVMEFIDGITLKDYTDKLGSLNWKEAVHYIKQVLDGLSHAHEKQVIHRDIKPQNIMLLSDGTVKVTDFGIAKVPNAESITMTDKAIGTVNYISPEQASGAEIDFRTDIYSAGVMLYEMLTGRLPFVADSPVAVAMMHVSNEPMAPREINAQIPEGLEQIVLKAMQKNPEDRFSNAAAMLKALDYFSKNPTVVFASGAKDTGAAGAKVNIRENIKKKEKMKKYIRGSRSMFPLVSGIAASFCVVALLFVIIWLLPFFKGTKINNEGASTVDALGNSISTAVDKFLGVDNNNDENRKVSVPSFVGKTFDETLVSEMAKVGFTPGTVNYVRNENYDLNTVVRQDPEEGAIRIIPESGKLLSVTLYVNMGSEEMQMPDCTLLNITDAKRIIRDQVASLSAKELPVNAIRIVEEYHDTFPAGYVIKTLPEPKALVKLTEDTEYIIYVSKGKKVTTTVVPKLEGKTVADAKRTVITSGLALGKIIYEESLSVPYGYVIRANYAAGTVVAKGLTSVDLVVSSSVNSVVLEPELEMGEDEKQEEKEPVNDVPEVTPDVPENNENEENNDNNDIEPDTTITENEQGSDNKAMEDVAGLLDLRNSDE